MKASFRLLTCLLLLCGLLFVNQFPCAAEGDVLEVTAEATCPIEGATTPAKAEGQALLAAKKNALAQAGVQELSQIYIDSLPKEVFDVTVLDKKKVIDGSRISIYVQIKALIKPDQLQAAVKGINSIWGGPAEYYQEAISYMNGKDTGRVKTWTKNNLERSEIDGTIMISKFEIKDNIITCRGITIKDNRYAANEPYRMIREEVSLGTEQVNGIMANKKSIVITYPDLKTTYTQTEWIDPATNCLVKLESGAGGNRSVSVVSVYQKAQIGPQDDNLFMLPAGCTKVAKVDDLYLPANAQQNGADPVVDALTQKAVEKVLDGLFY